MMASSSHTSPNPFFSHQVTEKLDDTNYLLSKQLVEPVIKSHKLHRFVVNPIIPPCFLSETDRDSGIVNPAYEEWEVQTNSFSRGFNLLCPRASYRMFLVSFIRINFGITFMNIFSLK